VRVVIGVLFLAAFTGLMRHGHRFEAVDGWGLLFVFATSAGLGLLLRRREGLRWIAAGAPFWTLANASGWMMFAALGLTIVGLAMAAVGPTLPGRRIRFDGEPLASLASGPLVAIAPQTFGGARKSPGLAIAAVVLAIVAVLLLATAELRLSPPVFYGLALAAIIASATFAFANWFAGRVRLRIDETGVHSRAMFGERSIPWSRVAGLRRRTVILPGMFLRIEYSCVVSPDREFAFPDSMPGAGDLRAAIESATGLQFS
jgi:hypothetical protein